MPGFQSAKYKLRREGRDGKVASLSIEQTEAGDNKRGLKIIQAQPGSGVCNHAHTAVGHGPAGRRLHITHTATGDITLLLYVEATHYTQVHLESLELRLTFSSISQLSVWMILGHVMAI